MASVTIQLQITGVGAIPLKSKSFTGNEIVEVVDLTIPDGDTVGLDVQDDSNDDILAVALFTDQEVEIAEAGESVVANLESMLVLTGEDCKKVFPSSPAVGLEFTNNSGSEARVRGVIVRANTINP